MFLDPISNRLLSTFIISNNDTKQNDSFKLFGVVLNNNINDMVMLRQNAIGLQTVIFRKEIKKNKDVCESSAVLL